MNHRRLKSIPIVFAICMPLAGCAPPVDQATRQAYAELTAASFARHVGYLADPLAGGRMTCTSGNERAVEYIRWEFERAGLAPAGTKNTWFQSFAVPSLSVPTGKSQLRLVGGEELVLGRDFSPMASGCQGQFAGPLVFAGYGLHNHVRNYNDYDDINVKGAVVMVFQGEPHGETGKSKWAAGDSWTHLSGSKYKIELAAEKGAAAVLLVTPPDISPDCDPLDDVYGDGLGAIPAFRISRQAAQRLINSGGQPGKLGVLMQKIHDTHSPVSFATGVRIEGNAAFETGSSRNIVGMLPAAEPDDAEASSQPALTSRPVTAPRTRPPAEPVKSIVLCAHYDHIPATGQHALDKGFGVRPGADDNASGVAALIMLANALSKLPDRKFNFIFLAAGAEEFGFYGSRYFVSHPCVPADSIAYMINFDQIGFIRNNTVYVLGAVNKSGFAEAIASSQKFGGDIIAIYLPMANTEYWSDQAPFASAGYKTLFFFSGLTRHRHTMTDRPDLVNNIGGARTAKLAFEIIRHIPEKSVKDGKE